MQLGFVTAIFPDQSFDEVLAFAAGEGFDCVEVMCWPPGGKDRKFGGVMHIDVSEFSSAKADDVRALCDKHKVAISGLGYYPNPLSANPAEAEVARAHLPKVIDAARTLGLQVVNTFIGANHMQSLEENFRSFQQVWPAIIRHAEERQIRIGIENCPMLFGDRWPFGSNLARSPAIWRRMFEAIPSNYFGLNYDPSHMVMQLMDPIAPIREFGKRIYHTHAKDMRIEHHLLNDVGTLVLPMERSTAKIPGLGDVNWDRWISALTDAGFDGAVCVEVEDEAFMHDLASRRKSLQVSRNVLRPLIG
jgi:sugar phosphate isomerase/epimerase